MSVVYLEIINLLKSNLLYLGTFDLKTVIFVFERGSPNS